MLESETLLRKSNVLEDDGNRGEHNEVGEAIAGSFSMYINPLPSRHIPTISVTAMIIQRATIDLEHQGINLKPLQGPYFLET